MRLAVAVSLFIAAGVGAAPPAPSPNWPSFRGPRASGVAEGHATAASWSVEKGEGILFRVKVPGLAHSSPVVWGDSVYVTSAVSAGEAPLKVGLYGDIDPVPNEGRQRYVLYRIDKRTGKVRWERTAHEGVPRRPRHTKSTHANPTPATDGRRVVAYFGSEGLYAYDTEGKLLWKKDLGPLDAAFFRAPDAQWGVASSPIVHDGVVYLQVDVLNEPFLASTSRRAGSSGARRGRTCPPGARRRSTRRAGARSSS
jgi:outer membrane protein assembly factor BamB